MPEKAPVEPPKTRMNIPQDVPKTESPAIPVPPPSGSIEVLRISSSQLLSTYVAEVHMPPMEYRCHPL